MPMACTGGRARCFNPYCPARFTIVATLFQFSPYSRAVPFQLNSRASTATALDSAVVTRAHGSALGGPLPPHLRDDFMEAGILIDVKERKFQDAVTAAAQNHGPDLIVIDNLAHVIAAEYNDSKRIQE